MTVNLYRMGAALTDVKGEVINVFASALNTTWTNFMTAPAVFYQVPAGKEFYTGRFTCSVLTANTSFRFGYSDAPVENQGGPPAGDVFIGPDIYIADAFKATVLDMIYKVPAEKYPLIYATVGTAKIQAEGLELTI